MRQIYKVTLLAEVEAGTPQDAVWGAIRGVMEGKISPYVEIRPRTVFPKHVDPNIRARPGTWWPAGTAAQVLCPNGHSIFLLPEVHTIRPNGEVSPSLVCNGCDFHAFITLEGWEDPKP